jgi:hypothetical protein
VRNLLLYILFLVLTVTSYSQVDNLSDKARIELFTIASGQVIRNDTVYKRFQPCFVVINVTDLKNGMTKEICTEYDNIEAAVDLDKKSTHKDKSNLTYRFYSDTALQLIGYFSFDTTKKSICLMDIKVEDLINDWKKDHLAFINKYSGDCETYYAYILFRHGILTKRGSLASELLILDEKEINERKQIIGNH